MRFPQMREALKNRAQRCSPKDELRGETSLSVKFLTTRTPASANGGRHKYDDGWRRSSWIAELVRED
jgi:hypothetical protein